jgi:hypothetical protein
MRSPVRIALVAVALLASACDEDPAGLVDLRVGGAFDETMPGAVEAVDYSDVSETTQWGFELAAARTDQTALVQVALFLPTPPALGQAYRWPEDEANVDSFTARLQEMDVQAQALGRSWEAGSIAYAGTISVTFTHVPGPGTWGTSAVLDVHGTLDATLPPADGIGPDVTLHADF